MSSLIYAVVLSFFFLLLLLLWLARKHSEGAQTDFLEHAFMGDHLKYHPPQSTLQRILQWERKLWWWCYFGSSATVAVTHPPFSPLDKWCAETWLATLQKRLQLLTTACAVVWMDGGMFSIVVGSLNSLPRSQTKP